MKFVLLCKVHSENFSLSIVFATLNYFVPVRNNISFFIFLLLFGCVCLRGGCVLLYQLASFLSQWCQACAQGVPISAFCAASCRLAPKEEVQPQAEEEGNKWFGLLSARPALIANRTPRFLQSRTILTTMSFTHQLDLLSICKP